MDILKSYFDFKNCIFCPFLPLLASLRARGFLCLLRPYDVILGRNGLKIGESSKKRIRSHIHAKKRRFSVPYVLYEQRRARGRARAEIFETLEMTWFALKTV